MMMPLYATNKNQVKDHAGNTIFEETVQVDITEQAVEYALTDKVRQAIQSNIDTIALIPNAIATTKTVIDTTAANLTQANAQLDSLANVTKRLLEDYERMLRQLVAIERLLVKSDLLFTDEGS